MAHPEWISPEDTMPEDDEKVVIILAYTEANGEISQVPTIGMFDGTEWWDVARPDDYECISDYESLIVKYWAPIGKLPE